MSARRPRARTLLLGVGAAALVLGVFVGSIAAVLAACPDVAELVELDLPFGGDR